MIEYILSVGSASQIGVMMRICLVFANWPGSLIKIEVDTVFPKLLRQSWFIKFVQPWSDDPNATNAKR